MARPVVLRPEADVANVVLALVVEADRVPSASKDGRYSHGRVGVIHRQVVGPPHRAKNGRPETGGLSFAIAAWNEWNDFRAHDNASHTAIATRPVRESDIRVAVMRASS
jgi:hypothetical protein